MAFISTTRIATAFALTAALAPCHGAFAKSPRPTAPELPVSAYASLPVFTHLTLSPDGKQIGYITQWKGRATLVMENLDGSDRVAIPPTEDADVKTFYWATDKRLLVVYEFSMRRGSQVVTTSQTRLMAIDRDGQNSDFIVKGKAISVVGSKLATQRLPVAQFQHQIVDLLPDDPEHILLALDADHDGAAEVWKLNIFNSRYKEVLQDFRGIQHWYADQSHTIRLGWGYDKAEHYAMLRDAEGHTVSLPKTSWYNDVDVIGFSSNPNDIYVTKISQYGTKGVYKLATDSGQITETVFEKPDVDVDEVVDNPETGWPAGVAYTSDRGHVVYFDEGLARIQRIIDKSLPGTSNRIIGKAKGKDVYVIFSYSDVDPGAFYFLDLEAKKMNMISTRMEGIDPATQAQVAPVSIPMRDGSHIPGYLTIPKGMEKAKHLKTIVLPHGGPEARDTAGWDYWAQFLANRGYLVLQPNFRGSTGYGEKFLEAGKHQWGGLMQDDVTDATKWLIKTGLADKRRICIVGGSYGGYAALMGVVQEPGLYKCAISINGVTDIPAMKNHDKQFIGGLAWVREMGLKGTSDSDVSPIDRVKDIKAPVLLISAKDDARVDYRQSKAMDSKLRGAHKKSRYVMLDDGGHTLDTAAARTTALTEMEKFLRENLGR